MIEVVNAHMERALRVITLERGYDPRDFALVAFGGAGPLHACDLAQRLEIETVMIPRFPGVLSALGALAGGDGVESGLGAARRALVRHADKAAGCFDQALAALDRAADETADALAAMEQAATPLTSDPRRLEAVEERQVVQVMLALLAVQE